MARRGFSRVPPRARQAGVGAGGCRFGRACAVPQDMARAHAGLTAKGAGGPRPVISACIHRWLR